MRVEVGDGDGDGDATTAMRGVEEVKDGVERAPC